MRVTDKSLLRIYDRWGLVIYPAKNQIVITTAMCDYNSDIWDDSDVKPVVATGIQSSLVVVSALNQKSVDFLENFYYFHLTKKVKRGDITDYYLTIYDLPVDYTGELVRFKLGIMFDIYANNKFVPIPESSNNENFRWINIDFNTHTEEVYETPFFVLSYDEFLFVIDKIKESLNRYYDNEVFYKGKKYSEVNLENTFNSKTILDLFDNVGYPYKKSGKHYVCRCPFCKNDNKLDSHNAIINVESNLKHKDNTIFCFTEDKLYGFKAVLNLFKTQFGLSIDINDIKDEFIVDDNIKTEFYSIKESFESENNKEKDSDIDDLNMFLCDEVNIEQEVKEDKTNHLNRDNLIKTYELQGFRLTNTYVFMDLDGNVLYEKLRFEHVDKVKGKKFVYVKDDKLSLEGQRLVPYGLNRFNSGLNEVWISEGEKCADAIYNYANVISISYNKPSDFSGFEHLFTNKNIVIFEDNDATGAKNTLEVIEKLKMFKPMKIGVVRFLNFQQGYDVADFLNEFGYEKLLSYIKDNMFIVYADPVLSVRLNLDLSDVDDNKRLFLFEPFIPAESVCLIDGLGEAGKTMLAFQLAFCLTLNKKFLGIYDPKSSGNESVLYVSAEDPDIQIKRRVTSLCAGLSDFYNEKIVPYDSNIHLLNVLSDRFVFNSGVDTYRLFEIKNHSVVKTRFFYFIEELISKLNPSLVIFDSLANFYGLDENATEQVIIFMESLKTLAIKYKTSILLLHHQTKEALRGLNFMFRGSMSFREQSRARTVLFKDELCSKIKSVDIKSLFVEKLNFFTLEKRNVYLTLGVDKTDNIIKSCFLPIKDEQINNFINEYENEQKQKKQKRKKDNDKEIEEYLNNFEKSCENPVEDYPVEDISKAISDIQKNKSK